MNVIYFVPATRVKQVGPVSRKMTIPTPNGGNGQLLVGEWEIEGILFKCLVIQGTNQWAGIPLGQMLALRLLPGIQASL